MTHPNDRDCTAFIDLMGEDFIAEIDFRLLAFARMTRYGPADPDSNPAEWEVQRIALRRDIPDAPGPTWQATGALLNLLAEDERVTDAILAAIAQEDAERPRRRGRGYFF